MHVGEGWGSKMKNKLEHKYEEVETSASQTITVELPIIEDLKNSKTIFWK